MNTPFFSLITVCFNASATIAQTLRSAQQQTHRDFELVIVDGASKDSTLDEVRKFPDLPISLSSEPDTGIYDAMNKGVARARGEVVYFLNADDRLHSPEVLVQVQWLFEAHPELDLVWGNVLYEPVDAPAYARTFGHIRPWNLVFLDLNHQGVFARRRLFDRLGPFNTSYRINADYDWLLRALRSGAAWRHIDLLIARFRVDGAHNRDPAFLRNERQAVRLQYIHPWPYHLGALGFRVQHKLKRLFALAGLSRTS